MLYKFSFTFYSGTKSSFIGTDSEWVEFTLKSAGPIRLDNRFEVESIHDLSYHASKTNINPYTKDYKLYQLWEQEHAKHEEKRMLLLALSR